MENLRNETFPGEKTFLPFVLNGPFCFSQILEGEEEGNTKQMLLLKFSHNADFLDRVRAHCQNMA